MDSSRDWVKILRRRFGRAQEHMLPCYYSGKPTVGCDCSKHQANLCEFCNKNIEGDEDKLGYYNVRLPDGVWVAYSCNNCGQVLKQRGWANQQHEIRLVVPDLLSLSLIPIWLKNIK